MDFLIMSRSSPRRKQKLSQAKKVCKNDETFLLLKIIKCGKSLLLQKIYKKHFVTP